MCVRVAVAAIAPPPPPTAAGMGVATAKTGEVARTTGGFVTVWFIILLLTTSMGLLAAVPRRPATKLAL